MASDSQFEITIVEDDSELINQDPSATLDRPRLSEDIDKASPSNQLAGDTSTTPANGDAPTATQGDTMEVEELPSRITFLSYLTSPIVTLHVGPPDSRHTLHAHHTLLQRSPFFSNDLAAGTHTFHLDEDEVDPVACFLEWLYTGEYFPRISLEAEPSGSQLETDPSQPAIDTTGEQILKHARVYTLARKLQVPDLKNLAHSKIHRVNSSAKGEISYARYVYEKTPETDTAIRTPVAAFWAHRSHVLRHDAEDEFRTMCLDFPKFAFDVLSLVLDQKEKGKGDYLNEGTGAGKRKRPRVGT